MSKKSKQSHAELEWLRSQHSNFTHHQIAERLGVCVDTAKRILMRHKLQYFPGAKYQIRPQPIKWRRPCIICGDTKPRTAAQYKCVGCTERELEASRVSAYSDEPLYKKPKKLEIPF
jgi:hypothetical protein